MLRPSSTRHVYFLPGILLLVGLPLHGQNKVTTKDCSLAAEDYAVYSAVFRSREHSVDPPLELVIVDETVTTEEVPGSDAWNFQSKSKPAPSNETIADVKVAWTETMLLETIARFEDHVHARTSSRNRRVFRSKGRRRWVGEVRRTASEGAWFR